MADDDPRVTRRQMLVGAAAVGGLGALAGCGASEESKQYAQRVADVAAERPPALPSNPDSYREPWTFIIASLDYQNRQAQAQTQGIEALLEDAGLYEGGGDGG